MDVNVLLGLAALVISLVITQIVKKIDKKNILADWYALIAIVIGGLAGWALEYYFIHTVKEIGILLGIVAPFAYDKLPESMKNKIWLHSNSVISATQLSSDRVDG